MANQHQEWTPEKLELAERMFRQRATQKQIAAATGFTVRSVARLYKRRGWRVRQETAHWPPDKVAKFENLYAAGVTMADIAARLGKSRTALKNFAARRGWIRPKPSKRPRAQPATGIRGCNQERLPWTKEECDLSWSMYSQGVRVEEIAATLRKKHKTVEGWIYRAGWRRSRGVVSRPDPSVIPEPDLTSRRGYSGEDLRRIKQMFDDGARLPEIARIFNRKANAIRRLAERRGWKRERGRPDPPPPDRLPASRAIGFIDRHIGQVLRAKREQAGFTLDAFAQRLDISINGLRSYEIARNRISAARLFEIAAELDCPITDFFDGIGG